MTCFVFSANPQFHLFTNQEQPTWQLLAGGIGRPKTMRYMFSTDYKPFELVMEAIASNRMDPEGRSVLLVVERRK
jgi:hypothetical protein